MTSPGVSQWTVNENSFGTQTTQTDNYWNNGDSFDSSKSFSMGKITNNYMRKKKTKLINFHRIQDRDSPRFLINRIDREVFHRFNVQYASRITDEFAFPRVCIIHQE